MHARRCAGDVRTPGPWPSSAQLKCHFSPMKETPGALPAIQSQHCVTVTRWLHILSHAKRLRRRAKGPRLTREAPASMFAMHLLAPRP